MAHNMYASPCFLPPSTVSAAARVTPTAQQRVALSPATHTKLKRLAARRLGGASSLSRLSSIVLTHYLSHMERVYFGRPGWRACVPVPAALRDIDAVIFDMDGVLCDSEHASRLAGAETLQRLYGVTVTADDFAPFTGTGEANFLAGTARAAGVPASAIDGERAKAAFFDVYVKEGFTYDLQAFPGVRALIERVRQMGLKVAVASAADAIKVDANLGAIGLPRDTFDFVTSSDDIVNKKPAPDVFLAAARGIDVEPSRCVVVEDAVAGVQAARAAGMRVVGVATSLPGDELAAAGAHVVREQPAFIEIADLFGVDVFAELDEGDGAGDAAAGATAA